MIRNNIKIAFRNLWRYKQYTLMNIFGLAVGVSCCVLIMLFVRSELSYDKFHSKRNRIYRVWQHEKYEGKDFIGVVTPIPMAAALKETYPEIESACRVNPVSALIKVNSNSFKENIRMVDSTFFGIFDFKLIEGDKNKPFPTENSVIITAEAAKKYFGSANPMGKNMELQSGSQKINFTVSGVSELPVEESSVNYDILISYANDKLFYRERTRKSWYNVFNETYVLLKENSDPGSLEKKFPAMLKQHLGDTYKDNNFVIHLQKLTDIHLDSSLEAGIEPTGNPKYCYIMSTIGILVLLLACINFITLSIGRSTTRALEVGIRKTLGAFRINIIRQFWGEAFFLTLISVITGLILAILFLGPFNTLIGKNLRLNIDWSFLGFTVTLIGLIALISGIYPAIIISGFNPVKVLKGDFQQPANAGIFRRGLVVGQFVVSISMIICAIVVTEQMYYLKNKDLGYNEKQMIVVATNKNLKEGGALAHIYRNELLKHHEVESVCTSAWSLAENAWANIGFTDDKKVYREFQCNAVDPHFIETMGIQIKEGRNFSDNNSLDQSGSALVNESFVKAHGLINPVGKKLPGSFPQMIVGVMKDFNFESLHSEVKPLVLVIKPDSLLRHSENVNFPTGPEPRVSVRLKAGAVEANIAFLKKAWKKVAPEQDFEYSFLDERLAAVYKQEEKTTTIVKIASALSIFIACMGLFGLATLVVTRRIKEIGVRKVLGANVSSIVKMIAKDFVLLVIIASIVSVPLAWWQLTMWLHDFAYKVDMQWWNFVAGCVITLFIAIVTVGWQAVRAALANPVKNLRTE